MTEQGLVWNCHRHKLQSIFRRKKRTTGSPHLTGAHAAVSYFQGAHAINGLVNDIDVPADKDSGKYKIHFARYEKGSRKGVQDSEEFDLIIGSDGANSRVAKARQSPSRLRTSLLNDRGCSISQCMRTAPRELCFVIPRDSCLFLAVVMLIQPVVPAVWRDVNVRPA